MNLLIGGLATHATAYHPQPIMLIIHPRLTKHKGCLYMERKTLWVLFAMNQITISIVNKCVICSTISTKKKRLKLLMIASHFEKPDIIVFPLLRRSAVQWSNHLFTCFAKKLQTDQNQYWLHLQRQISKVTYLICLFDENHLMYGSILILIHNTCLPIRFQCLCGKVPLQVSCLAAQVATVLSDIYTFPPPLKVC